MKPLVSVILIAYNHESYIEEAIKSIVTQNTDFNFELIVGEDRSTDGTLSIVKEYQAKWSHIIQVITSNKNVGITDNLLRCLKAAKGKYIAFCEGDDYWCSNSKLQKQVDFLEQNPEFGLVHSDVNHLDDKTGRLTKAYNSLNEIKIPSGFVFEFLMKPSHSVKTMTVCFRKTLLDQFYLSNNEIMSSDWKLIDISMWLMLAQKTKFFYFNEALATYRLLPESTSRSKNPRKLYEFHQKIFNIRFYFLRKYITIEENRLLLFKSYYRSLISDGYNLKNLKILNHGKKGLQRMNVRLTIKQRLFEKLCLLKNLL
ncbi:MAG: glycosyltransferase [Salinivirgaceae bacterium]|nr:glycosyltransferase [Salinivirgaceae bacterium]